MARLEGKIALVTGGTKGIGLATVQKMVKEGAKVHACARHLPETGIEGVQYHCLDVSDSRMCEELVQSIIQAETRIDILVANAGIVRDSLTVKMTDEAFDQVISVNLKGVFNMVRVAGPAMERAGGGSIITVSSIVGEYGNIGQANYAASKAGVIAMTKSWAKEFARKGVPVRVNSVAPGYIMTEMLEGVPQHLLEQFASQTMLKRLGRPEEIADVIAYLSSDEASYITGSVIDVNGGMRL